jgi:rhamnosyltransferase
LTVLKTTIQSLIHQVSHIYLVDNTPGSANEVINNILRELDCSHLITILIFRDNLGISRAQNEGIKMAINDKCDFIMLSDQDTSYSPHCVKKLLDCLMKLQRDGINIAAISPAYVNSHAPEIGPCFLKLKGFCMKKVFITSGLVEATQIIASGQLIPAAVFAEVGLMDEQLFIDWVDTEWCWRAQSKGFKIYGCGDVVIRHTMGDNIKVLCGRPYSLRSPVRHYYMIRNGIILALHRPDIPWKIRVFAFFRTLKLFFGIPLFSTPRFIHFRHIVVGLAHGLMNRYGKY